MMRSSQGRSFINPVVQRKMEGAVGTVVTPGIPKADSLSHYSHDKAPPISRGFFPYSLSGQDAFDFKSSWDPSKTCLRNESSPGIHPSPTEASVTIPGMYRPENLSFPVDGGGRSAGAQELAAKQSLVYYASSPGAVSPRAAGIISPVAVPQGHIAGSGISSTDAESCVGLTIPKPVYGHSPCCTGRGCTAGHNYGVDHGSHTLSPRIYEDEWATHFSHLAYLHKKGQEALTQQRALQLEHGAEGIPLKDGKTEGYHGIRSNGPGRSLILEPSHSSYTYNASHPFIGSTPEFCQRVPIPLQIHRGLPTTYDPRTMMHHGVPSKANQDHPHVPKYTHIPPYSYYTHNVITDEHSQHHMPPFHPSRPDFNMSPSCPIVPPHHPLITRFPAYHPYNMHLNSNQPPLYERPSLPLHQSEGPLDFSLRRVHTPDSPGGLCRQSGTPGAFHPTPAHHTHPGNRAAERSAFDHTEAAVTGFPVEELLNVGTSHEELFKKKHRHHVSHSPNKDSQPKRLRDESESVCEIDSNSKKRKTEPAHEQSEEPWSPSSPPMPVINKVFSLAPYRVYFDSTGVSPLQENFKKPQHEVTQFKQEAGIQKRDLEANSGENDLSSKQQPSPVNSNCPLEVDKTIHIKKEKLDPDETGYHSEMKVCIIEEINHQAQNLPVKEEEGEIDSGLYSHVLNNVVLKSDIDDLEGSSPPLEEPLELSNTCKTEPTDEDNKESVTIINLPSVPPVTPPLINLSLSKIPPHCLKLSNYKVIVPEVLTAPTTQSAEVPHSPVEAKSTTSSSKQARHQFMELHQSLCRLIHGFVNHTPCQELQDWLCKLELQEMVSHPSKAQRVSCLIGSKIREVWLKGEEMVMALKKVVCQLQMYVDSSKCPFPHVMRAGAVFIPMLVVKEVLFPQVQGTFIDQVLQEHRVELRPTTLTEEKQLTQLHRKAFSSKLRRLLSLKHLPDIYPDVLNLLFYTNVCKFLGPKTSLTFRRESTDSSDESFSCVDGPEKFYLKSSVASTTETTCVEKLERRYCLTKKKGRVKISSKRTFLEETSSSQEEDVTVEPERWSIVDTFETEEWEVSSVACNESEANVEVEIEDGTLEEPNVDAWRQPLTSDDFSESSNEETESTSSLSYQSHRSSSGKSKRPSSMVLKLRKVFFNEDRRGGVTYYQKVTDTLEAHGSLRGHGRFRSADRGCYRKKKRKSSRLHTDWKFPSRLHSSYSPNCPFLSTKHRSKRRRRWVLRSATQSACLAVENRYPDLVGKRIRHLYEEKDKTEVWYRGVVLRIHEPHVNPLKTVFEVKYDSEPEWQYYLELLLDYKKGWLKVED